jgi:hypothetical protein
MDVVEKAYSYKLHYVMNETKCITSRAFPALSKQRVIPTSFILVVVVVVVVVVVLVLVLVLVVVHACERTLLCVHCSSSWL